MADVNITINPNDIITGRSTIVNGNIVTAGSTISKFYTCSAQKAASSSNYYISLYLSATATASVDNQLMDVSYGASTQNNTTIYYSSSEAIYDSYASQCLSSDTSKFVLNSGSTVDSIMAINYNLVLLKDRICTTGFNLMLSQSTFSASLSLQSSSVYIPGIHPYCGRVRYLGTSTLN